MLRCKGLLLIFILFYLGGCAATQQTKTAKPSGFLSDYSMLRKGGEGEAQLVYINPKAKFLAYDKVMVDPVTVWVGKDSKLAKGSNLADVAPEDRQRLANDLWAKINLALKPDYEIVHHPGPGVMRIQVAITEAEQSTLVLDTITSLHPATTILTGAVGMVRGGHPSFAGKTSVEGKITDAQTGTLLLAGVDQRAGTKALKGFNTWGDVEKAYQYWADQLRYRLCTLRGGENCEEPKA